MDAQLASGRPEGESPELGLLHILPKSPLASGGILCCCSLDRKSILQCAISTFIEHGKGNSGRAISGPLPVIEGLPRGEPVGLLSRTAWARRAASVPTSQCAEVLPWVGKCLTRD